MPTTLSRMESAPGHRRRVVVGLLALVLLGLLVVATGGHELRPEAHRMIVPGACAP